MKALIWRSFPVLLVALVGCGEGDDLADRTTQAGEQTLVAGPSGGDSLFCPYGDRSALADADVAFASAVSERPNLRRGWTTSDWLRPVPSTRSLIRVHLDVEPLGSYLLLRATFRNPYRCDWTGHLFVERELPWDASDAADSPGNAVDTLARRYGVHIPGGGTVRVRLLLDRPLWHFPQEFLATAYTESGAAKAVYDFCISAAAADSAGPICPPVDPAESLVVAEEVREATWEEPVASSARPPSNDTALLPCPGRANPPIRVGLELRGAGNWVQAMASWLNANRGRTFVGDLYVDVTHSSGQVEVMRRDLRMEIPPGLGFCTYDDKWLPAQGIYLFTARALRLDGRDRLTWHDPGTTEIYSVCSGDTCESIAPEQHAANLTLTGESAIWLYTDFFSEYTRVTLEWAGGEFDITELCTINQYIGEWRNHMEVRFDTMNLPIGPRTWAEYTIALHPMPVVEEGAKLTDTLRVRTNGPE